MCSDAMNFDLGQSDQVGSSCIEDKVSIVGEDVRDKVEPSKNRYGPKVLVDDWFDKRAVYVPPPDDWASVYEKSYPCKDNKHFLEDRKLQKNSKIKVEQGLGIEFLIQYYGENNKNNYTTTNELFYRLFPRDLCGPQKRKYSSRLNKWISENDLNKNYIDLKTNNSKNVIDCEDILMPIPPEYFLKNPHKNDEIKPIKRFPKHSGFQNIPYLDHLDIDPSKPFKPRLTKPKIYCHSAHCQ